jgi:ABC-type multidrug transport system fused ATPase/permease subunit
MSDLSLPIGDNSAPTPASDSAAQSAITPSPAGPPAPDIVLIENVTKSFGYKVALQHVSFGVPSGQICGLLGPNGAGKTTLFRLLMGILKATEGRLLVDGHDAFDDRVEVKRLIGFLPDEPVFYSYLSGREHLQLSAAMHGLDPDEAFDRMEPVIATLRLADDIDNYAEDYSSPCFTSPNSPSSTSPPTASTLSPPISSTTSSLKPRARAQPSSFPPI